jgi:arylsulfatase A-like enzyme
VLAALFLSLGALAAPERPNVLFLISDDQRADTIAALGNDRIRTPHLDTLVERGFVFERAYCMGSTEAAVCAPSRAMLNSGKTLFRIRGSFYDLTDPDPLLGEVLQEAGWRTFGTGKWHNGPRWFNRAFGDGDAIFLGGYGPHRNLPVNKYQPSGKYRGREYTTATFSSTEFADATIGFIERLKEDERFFAYVSFTAPHDPRTPPKAYRDLYDPDEMVVPPHFMPGHPFDNGDMWVRDELLAGWPRMEEVVQQALADYYALITHMDVEVGRILAALEASGRTDNTIVVFCSDHGLSLGGHGLMGKQNLYDDSMRAPLVIAGPGIPKGSSKALVYLFDLYPTLCELLGVQVPKSVEGKSLAPIVRGESKAVRDSIFTAYLDIQRAVRDERWKLIRYPNVGVTQLFDLEADPWELNDLSRLPEHSAKVGGLTALLRQWQEDLGDRTKLDRGRNR